jgi:hypothetical protein
VVLLRADQPDWRGTLWLPKTRSLLVTREDAIG